MQAHERTIVTSAPDVMWGTDGVRVFTAEDGWVWPSRIDHWNGRVRGLACVQDVARFAALEPIAQGLGRRYGSVDGGRGPPGWRYEWITAASIYRTTSSISFDWGVAF